MTPSRWTGFFASNSAAKAWCARTGVPARVKATPAIATADFRFIAMSPLESLACLFREIPVYQIFHEFHALELHQSGVLFHVAIKRHLDFPWPRVHFGI